MTFAQVLRARVKFSASEAGGKRRPRSRMRGPSRIIFQQVTRHDQLCTSSLKRFSMAVPASCGAATRFGPKARGGRAAHGISRQCSSATSTLDLLRNVASVCKYAVRAMSSSRRLKFAGLNSRTSICAAPVAAIPGRGRLAPELGLRRLPQRRAAEAATACRGHHPTPPAPPWVAEIFHSKCRSRQPQAIDMCRRRGSPRRRPGFFNVVPEQCSPLVARFAWRLRDSTRRRTGSGS